MEILKEGKLSERLEDLMKMVKDIQDDLLLIDGDYNYNRKIDGIKEYSVSVNQCEKQYNQLENSLKNRVEEKNANLLRFIFEWGMYDYKILIALAEYLGLVYGWTRMPGRERREYR